MKNRFFRTSYKAIAVVLSVLILCGTVLSGVAGIVILKNEFHTRTEASLRTELFESILQNHNSRVFYDVIEEGDHSAPPTYAGNYFYRILDKDGRTVAETYDGRAVLASYESELYWEEYLPDKEIYEVERYTVIGYVSATLESGDIFYMTYRFMQFMYQVRYWVFVWIALGLLLETTLLIYLFCAAGNHPGETEPRLNPTDKIPLDLATILLYFIAVVEFALLNEFGDLATVMLLIFFGVLDYLLLLWYFLTMAARLKKNCLIRSTLLGRFILWEIRVFKEILKNLPLIWKVATAVAIVVLAELVLFGFNIWDPVNLTILLVAEKVILIPLVYYIAVSLHRLKKGGERLAAGNLEERLDTSYLTGEFKQFGETLNSIGDGMNRAVEERMKSERFKTELITNVSHDIKTPLTSIINYVDLIKKEKPENENVRQYLEVLERQSARLKKLIEDLVEASKASTGNLSVHPEVCDAGVLLTQLLGEYDERFRANGLEPIFHQPETAVTVLADPRHFWRILDNLMVNIIKYAQSGTRVYLDLTAEQGYMNIMFRNISRASLNISGEELMERFVRGDGSRNTEGSGLGLSIARSLAELQGGSLRIDVDGDLFKVVLQLPRIG